MNMKIYTLLTFINYVSSYKLINHPIENRIAYIQGINNIDNIDDVTMKKLQDDFEKHPLLIFKNIKNVSPKKFIKFTSQFDKDVDKN